MPDWSFHPILKPIGIALHGDRTRELTLRRLRTIGSSAVGRWLIRFMGHSAPAETVAVYCRAVRFPSPVVLGSSIDPNGQAFDAFAQMEFGAIEVVDDTEHASRNGVVVIQRTNDPASSRAPVVRVDADYLAGFVDRHPLVLVDLDLSASLDDAAMLVAHGAAGFVIETAARSDDVVRFVRQLRNAFGAEVLIVAGGYVATPREAVELRNAGADLLLVGESFASAGPGLAKRINEAVSPSDRAERERRVSRSWICAALFGAGIVIASLIATYVALTSVILGYDERFARTNLEQLHAINPRLVDFMSHDRLSYAGATLSLGILYTALAVFGIRGGHKWAFHTFVAAGIGGFLTFLLFFAYGYFDVGNALVALVVLPFFIAAVVHPPSLNTERHSRDLDNDAVWRRSLVGQLCFVTLAAGLILGGGTICIVGSANVFVISDLAFLGTTSHHIEMANDRLLPLIAHDRVSFGGTIVCNGIATLLIGLWGFKRGESWVWWSLLTAGTLNLAFVFYAHLATDYTEIGHLLPVVAGAAFFLAGLILSRRFLCDPKSHA